MSISKRALVTGVSGQDGSYLAELLLQHGYDVFGLTRPGTTDHPWRIAHLADRITLIPTDLMNDESLKSVIDEVRPQEIYNLAAVTSLGAAATQPELAMALNGGGVERCLNAILSVDRSIRFCQASSAEVFGQSPEVPQRETTPLNPVGPYACAKASGHRAVIRYRTQHGGFAVSGILFNHESPRRGLEFVSRRVTDGVARIALGLSDTLTVGNLDARRDWGFAGDYVRALWLMVQQPRPDDYVIATGETRSVGELVEVACSHVGIDWRQHVRSDPSLVRPAEPTPRVGDASRARAELGWAPTVGFVQLIHMMVDADLDRLRLSPGVRSPSRGEG
ncbi:MAG TPA: GDP-mannose 4,6-dehydratase [Vicinamibacterales bacterium]|nr:GDP-mannose 4,6-dehydratase [Vicinamibacterales bacterium]